MSGDLPILTMQQLPCCVQSLAFNRLAQGPGSAGAFLLRTNGTVTMTKPAQHSPGSKFGSREKAQGLVEFALVVPILLILAMSVVDFGWGLRAYLTVTNSAREGARLGITCATDQDIKDRVVAYSNGLIGDSNVTVVSNPCKNGGKTGDPLTVKVAYDYKYITPLGALMSLSNASTLKMTSTTTMRAE